MQKRSQGYCGIGGIRRTTVNGKALLAEISSGILYFLDCILYLSRLHLYLSRLQLTKCHFGQIAKSIVALEELKEEP